MDLIANTSFLVNATSNASLLLSSLENNLLSHGITGLASLFSIVTNSYVICIIKVLASKENSLAILNLSILEILSSVTVLSEIFLGVYPEACTIFVQLRLCLFVVGLYSVGYVNMEIYLKIFEPFSDSYTNSRLLCILSAWSSGLITLIVIRCLSYQTMECDESNIISPHKGNFQHLFVGIFVFILGLPSFLTLSFQISVFVRILQHRRLRHRGRISLKKKKSTEISSNFSTVSSSSSTIASKECLRVIVLKASTSSAHAPTSKVSGCKQSASVATATQLTVTRRRRSICGLRGLLSDDRKMVISSGILIVVFLGGQLLPNVLTIISVVQWKDFLPQYIRKQILSHCRCFVAVLHPLIYGILRENFRNLFKMLQKRRNRSLS